MNGALLPVLHAHLPFVRHPEHPEFLEEDWLFEAITETYIPLIDLMERLGNDGVRFRLTMTLTPTLCEMLDDALLMERYSRRLGRLRDLAGHERARLGETPFAAAVDAHRSLLSLAHDTFERRSNRRLLPRFRSLQEAGVLEIITCGATHAFLPNISNPKAVDAQIAVAAANYRKHFGRAPRGIWLPECGYAPGLDAVLARHGIQYFFLDAHGILNGSRLPRHGIFAPIRTPAGPHAFARDVESSKQVWSADEGYPGDGVYREFYRDTGYDAPLDYIRPWLHADGIRRNVGLKYHKITGRIPLHLKEAYDPAAAMRKAEEHAANFVFNRSHQAGWLRSKLGRPACIVSPYDAELYGHWWFEGPRFLESVFRRLDNGSAGVSLILPSEWLTMNPHAQVMEPSPSTWGDKGYGEVWLNPDNDWIYRHQHRAEDRMVALAQRHRGATGLLKRALDQAARELLLAQASDWAFLMTVGTAVPYACRRFKEHIDRFTRIADRADRGEVDESALGEIESRDTIFPEIDFRVYA